MDIFKDLEKLQQFTDAFNKSKDGVSMKKILVENFGVSEEQATKVEEKMNEIKEDVSKKLLEGKIKSKEDLLGFLETTGFFSAESLDTLMKKLDSIANSKGDKNE